MSKLKITGIVVGTILGIAALACLAVCIGSAVNGLTFTQQLTNWFSFK